SGGSSGAEDISVQQNQNSEYKDFSKKSMTDKIKYAKNHNFTFLYAYEKVNPEDFDYKNSGIVIFEDLKFVLGIPK
ncbi:MAG: hypothetical protein HFH68_14185, partial [Lachnospiraceae bacterium]|nr:hypothetical protein [Lachnospiraceae bacterium]